MKKLVQELQDQSRNFQTPEFRKEKYRTEKNKQKFVDIISIHSPSGANSKKNIYQIRKRIFLQFKKEITSKDPETGLEVDRGVFEEKFKENLERF